MKEISKRIIISIIAISVFMGFFSCKMDSLVTYESEAFEKFKNGSLNETSLPDELYYARIMTNFWLDLIISKYSKENDFHEISVKNISIVDDKNNLIYQSDSLDFDSFEVKDTDIVNAYHYKIYHYQINDEELRLKLKECKTKHLIFNFEIDGKKYSEKLKRFVETYPILRT